MITSHNSDYALSFYNDRVKEVIEAGIIAEPFTYVPIKAGHMELVEGNALVFGKITEGYDVIAVDVRTEIEYTDVSLENPIIDMAVNYSLVAVTYTYYNLKEGSWWEVDPNPVDKSIWDGTQSWRTLWGIAVVTLPMVIDENSSYSVSILNTVDGINITGTYEAQPGDTVAEVKAGLIAALKASGVPDAEFQMALPGVNRIWFYARTVRFQDEPNKKVGDISAAYTNFNIRAYILALGLTIKYPQLKCGAVHSFGIVYKDRAGRTCSVIKPDDMSIYIPFYTEDIEGSGNTLQSIINLKFKISHTPPEWAETYEIVYFGNVSMDYYLQVRASDITQIPLSHSNGHRYSINIADTITWAQNQNNRWKLAPYEWSAGDRLRLVGTIDAGTGYGEAIGGGFVYDYEIEATGTQYNEEAVGGDWLIVQAVDKPTPFVGETNIIVEVYRPRKGLGQTVAYGTGMVFDIGVDVNGNRYHKGDVDQNIALDTPATVNNTANDCWKFFRLNYKQTGTTQTGIIQPFWAESIFPSDWWEGQDMNKRLTSNGFPFLDDLSQRQTVLDERLRHGGFLITGTRTNNIAHFTFEDFRDLQKKDGDITGLRQVGFTLKVVQMYKETSIYINRIQTFNPDGTEQFTLTDTFLGTMRPMETSYGCQHPESVMVNGRNLYYWDHSEGVFVRSSPNGQEVLDTKMKRYFKDIVRWIQTSGGREALSVNIGANNDFDEIWITFRMGSEVRGLIYNEKDNRYKSRLNQITESYIHLGNFFAHLYKQTLWIMNIDEGQEFLKWAGTPTYAEFEVVSNVDALKNKVFNACAVLTDHEPESLARTVVIPEEASACEELMETNIPLWERKEGIFYGKIMKDENSKGNFASALAKKMNGREMRGRYCFLKFRTEEHDGKVRVNSVVIFSTPSERNV